MDTSQMVKCIFETDGYRVNVVMDGNELFTLLIFENWSDISFFLPIFNDLGKRPGFTDFVGCFAGEAEDTAIYAAFRYYDEDLSGLAGINKEASEQKLRIFENILKRLVVLNPPVFLTAAMLKNPCVYDDGRVEFNYFLTDPWSIKEGLSDGQAELSVIFYKMFKRYIKPNNGLSIFYKRLQHGGFEDFFSVYEEFISATENFARYEPRKFIDLNGIKERAVKILSLKPKSRKDYITVGSRYVYNKLFLVLLMLFAGVVFAAAKALMGG